MTKFPHFNDPKHWQQRAEEARIQAEEVTTCEAKRTMLSVARDYDILAERAETRLARGEVK